MGDQTTYITEGAEVYHSFLISGMFNVSVEVWNRVGNLSASTSILVLPEPQSVRIHTEKQAYTTGAIITFLAVSEEPDPLEFLWHFGEGPPQRTTSRSIKKRYHFPGRYNVVVSASNGRNSFTSNIHPIVIQRKVQPNRLLFSASVLLNTTVTFDCRINSGTNVTYTWSFGDGTWKTGRNTEHHVYERVGEFTVEVTVSNLVSSASLRRQIFVVSQPCQPPPVKNMGPVRIQLRRYQTMQLGVTYEGDIHCNISQDLLYTWALYESTGAPVQLPVIETHQQSIRLPSHFLHYGIYIATARIQIKDTVVYNNYTVHVEVVPSPPVSLIFGGTNIFISTHNDTVLILNGQGSYDPDYPENILSYQWACKPISNIHSTCFDGDFPASSPLLVFPSGILKPNFDQFRFTLTVRSGDRSSSSEVFVTITADLKRKVHVYCNHCQGTLVNWNEQFSVTALCENCEMSPGNIFYTWTFHLVNASSKVITERDFKIPLPPYSISEFPVSEDGSVLYDDPFIDFPAEFPVDSALPAAFESGSSSGHSEAPFAGSDLGSEGSGTRTEAETSRFNYSDWGFFTEIEEAATGISRDIEQDSRSKDFLGSRDTEGNNLMDSSNPYLAAPERTLLDLERHQISPAEFHTYTTTGITSNIITFKPFVLKPKSLYMLEVSASTQETMLGKTQFFFSTSDVPQGMACQVQPSRGYEIHTDFSIFCTSGQADLHYEYSYSTGSTPRRVLYRGRDFQHYFNLPSGEPQNSYKVTIYTQVRNQFGAATRPCPVTVEVLPSYRKNLSSAYSPEKKLYLDGLESLAKLTQKGNGMEVRNHIFLLTNVLNRLSQEPSAFQELQTTTRSVLISVVCEQAMPDQFREQSAQDTRFLDELTVRALVSLLSLTLEALVKISKGSTQLMSTQLTSDVIHTISDLLLKHVLFSQTSQYSLSTSLMDLRTFLLHGSFQKTVKNVGLTKFYLPDGLDTCIHGHDMDSPNYTDCCIVSQLTFFRQNPYFWDKADVQIHGHVADLTLYNCSTKTEIKVRHLSAPVTIEFPQKHQNRSGASQFCLQRSHMNVHQFNVTPENLQEVLLITVRFIRPTNRTFPIMILLRNFERPTPALYNSMKIHHWERDTVFIFLPLSSLNDPSRIYLALLNADYNRTHGNKYIASSVNYTVMIECIQCLFWDGAGEWKADGCIPMQGQSSGVVKCSCNHLTTFTVAYREIQSHLEFICVSRFVSLPGNLTLCSAALISLVTYLLAAIICKGADSYCGERRGSVQIPDNSPSDRQLYAVTVDTGFRSRDTMTAKVYIVLHGEDRVSQTRELHVSDQLLFTRNSRHTFIISTPESLGPIWKVHLWHDNRGRSPSWYVSHVAIRDLVTGAERFFPGECWLAVDEGDGRVEKELIALTGPLEFRKVLYSKLTEYLEDLHSWASVYSRPSYSRFTHAQRLGVCLLLLQGYMCANATLLSLQDHELGVDLGPLHMSAVSLVMGILSTLVVLPVGALLSLLFRLSKTASNKESSVIHKKRVLDISSVEAPVRSAHSDGTLADDPAVQPHLSWQHLQQWTQGVWMKKYGHAVEDSRLPWQVPVTYGDKEEGWCNCLEKSRCSRDHSDLQKNHHAHGCLSRDQDYGSGDITLPPWCRSVAWTLCLTLSLVCAIVSAVLGTKFSASESLLWAQALGFSLLLCGFVLQPALIFIGATVVAVRYRRSCHFHTASPYTTTATEMQKQRSHNGGRSVQNEPLTLYHDPQEQTLAFTRVLAARRRARYLRLARPPTPAELRRVRGHMRKRRLIDRTLREAVLCGTVLLLLLAISAGKPSANYYQLNQAIKSELLQSAAVSRIQRLQDGEWFGQNTRAVAIQFTLFNPPTGLFTAVSLLVEQPIVGGLLPSTIIQSTRVYRTTGTLDRAVIAFEFYFQLWAMSQQSFGAYWVNVWNWLEVTIIVVSLFYYVCCVYERDAAADTVDLLQKHNFKAFVDLTAAVLIMAFSRLEDLRFHSTSHALSGLAGSFRGILARCMMIGAISSLSKAARKVSRREDLVTLSEVAAHVRGRIHEFTGKRKPTRSVNHTLANNFYLEEFEALVDELLFRLDAVTDSPHHTLPSEALGYEESERSLTPRSDRTGSLLFEVGKPGFLQTCANGRSTAQLETFQQRESPRLAFPTAFKVSSPLLHSEELRMESKPLDTLLSDGKNKSSGQCRPCNLAQLEGDLPHILCGSRCPGKRAASKLCTRNHVSHKGPQTISVQPMCGARGDLGQAGEAADSCK
ncbi:polycystic kidney disease protein 1-like 1 [Scleropages formosus]|uniref:polycystic kidney disease protein 1-like 1 n=1 Tax=Scleropages formosus TaxID=113540 RepID=UPI0010FA6AAB|nr:polycystic kidney disease protein 1-like 1 [Scleropages formosus]